MPNITVSVLELVPGGQTFHAFPIENLALALRKQCFWDEVMIGVALCSEGAYTQLQPIQSSESTSFPTKKSASLHWSASFFSGTTVIPGPPSTTRSWQTLSQEAGTVKIGGHLGCDMERDSKEGQVKDLIGFLPPRYEESRWYVETLRGLLVSPSRS